MTEAAALYEVGGKKTRKEQDMQGIMLRRFMGQQVHIHLVNGIRLTGMLTAHDKYAIVLDARQLVFKHAITTIQPGEHKNYKKKEAGDQAA